MSRFERLKARTSAVLVMMLLAGAWAILPAVGFYFGSHEPGWLALPVCAPIVALACYSGLARFIARDLRSLTATLIFAALVMLPYWALVWPMERLALARGWIQFEDGGA